jgi:hypothetical protein
MEWQAHEPKSVAVRATAFENPELSASGEALEFSDSAIEAYLPLQFTPGTLVCINIKDSVRYGLVLDSIPERSFFRTGIELVQR